MKHAPPPVGATPVEIPELDSITRAAIDAISASPAIRLRFAILAAKNVRRASQPVLPPSVDQPRPHLALEDLVRGNDAIATLIRLRAEAAREVEWLLKFLDDTDGDLDEFEGDPAEQTDDELRRIKDRNDDVEGDDREADDADDEPSLGAPEIPPAFNRYFEKWQIWLEQQGDQTFWAKGSDDGRECEPEHDEDGADEEPSLGSTSAFAQVNWANGDATDLEGEHDGCEPDESGIADRDGLMEQCPALFEQCSQRVE